MIIKEKVDAKKYMPSFENIHGHVCIDLHNHNSGFTERIEADNIVTNALKYIFPLYIAYGFSQASGLAQSSGQELSIDFFSPIPTGALGGIMLFDGALDNSMSNVAFPSSVKLVGYAGQTAVTGDSLRGSVNLDESGKITNGYRTVWDFATDQANGTIAALSRTSTILGVQAGWTGLSNNILYSAHKGYNFTTPEGNVLDFDGQYVTFLDNSNLYKMEMNYGDYYVFQPFYNAAKSGTSYSGMPKELIETMSSKVGSNYYKYYHPLGSSSTGGAVRIDYKNSTTLTMYIIRNDYSEDDPVNITLSGGITLNSTVVNNFGTIYGNNYYVPSTDYTKIYKINLNNTAQVEEISIPEGYIIIAGIKFTPNGLIKVNLKQVSNNSSHGAYIYPDKSSLIFAEGTIFNDLNTDKDNRFPGTYINDIIECNNVNYGNIYLSLLFDTNYLGTIANISPVTKTASQSMKITYTLTNA